MPVDYQFTKIYKLVLNGDLDKPIYVGSTTQKYLSNRMAKHRKDFKAWRNGKSTHKYAYFQTNLEINNVKIDLIEEFSCDNILQSNSRELYWIQYYNLNQNKPQQINTNFDDCLSIQEKTKIYNEQYYQLNIEQMKTYNSTKKECDLCGKMITQTHLQRHKIENCPKRSDLTIKNKATKKPCDLCGKVLTSNHLARHKRESCPNRNISIA